LGVPEGLPSRACCHVNGRLVVCLWAVHPPPPPQALVLAACQGCRAFLSPDVTLLFRVVWGPGAWVRPLLLDARRVVQILSNGLRCAPGTGTATLVGCIYAPPSRPPRVHDPARSRSHACPRAPTSAHTCPAPARPPYACHGARPCSNAGKFTAAGAVTVEATVLVDSSGPDPAAVRHYVVLTVTNPRRGPPIANTEDMFVPFKGTSDLSNGSSTVGAAAMRVAGGGEGQEKCVGCCLPGGKTGVAQGAD
jgi:hypothetical protein